MAKGIKRRIRQALKSINKEISDLSNPRSLYSSGLSSEGYAGGYRDALNDVILLLNGIEPNRRGWYK